ncbi:hypothetical protein Ancab_029312 [Ancistrocladus abbreviatus]
MRIDDGESRELLEMNVAKLDAKDLKSFEQVQKIIDAGQVDKLKVDQCKMYLRKHGLRLTGKKDTLIQRIKEHLEILNGEGEEKYPPSSFVLNCKGDACMGDVVLFEQNVYEGFNIVSRSAGAPPCGKRLVAGRIVKESYGTAKQQHTFTVEVLWSKGDKALPPLHPLLVKGRNLYRLNTARQNWEDEKERQRVLHEKHSRGQLARSNREARIAEKNAKKMLRAKLLKKEEQRASGQQRAICKTQRQFSVDSEERKHKAQLSYNMVSKSQQEQTHRGGKPPRVPSTCKENICPTVSKPQVFQQNKPTLSTSHPIQQQNSQPLFGHKVSTTDPPPLNSSLFLHDKPAMLTVGSKCPNSNSLKGNMDDFHDWQTISEPFDKQGFGIKTFMNGTIHQRQPLARTNKNHSNGYFQNLRHPQPRQLCRYYAQSRCYYGHECKYLHDSNRNRDHHNWRQESSLHGWRGEDRPLYY